MPRGGKNTTAEKAFGRAPYGLTTMNIKKLCDVARKEILAETKATKAKKAKKVLPAVEEVVEADV
jgi:hypothetical protein